MRDLLLTLEKSSIKMEGTPFFFRIESNEFGDWRISILKKNGKYENEGIMAMLISKDLGEAVSDICEKYLQEILDSV